MVVFSELSFEEKDKNPFKTKDLNSDARWWGEEVGWGDGSIDGGK